MGRDNKITNEKLSASDCKKILAKNGKIYSDEEIISIRDLLYCFAQIDIDTYYHMEKKEREQTKPEESGLLGKANPKKQEENIIKNAA